MPRSMALVGPRPWPISSLLGNWPCRVVPDVGVVGVDMTCEYDFWWYVCGRDE